MNENQYDHNSDFNLDDSISQQHQVSEIAAGYDQNYISIEPPQPDYNTQPNWESNNQLDNGFSDNSNLSLSQSNLSDDLTTNSFEHESISYTPDTAFFQEQNSYLPEQHSFQDLNHQEMYDATTNVEEIYSPFSSSEIMNGGGTTFDDINSPIDHYEVSNSTEASSYNDTFNNHAVEQPFGHQTSSLNPDINYNQQRNGREPTAEELNQANKLVHQAELAHQVYENAVAWGKHYGNQSSFDKAAEYKQKEEELRAKADQLRNPS